MKLPLLIIVFALFLSNPIFAQLNKKLKKQNSTSETVCDFCKGTGLSIYKMDTPPNFGIGLDYMKPGTCGVPSCTRDTRHSHPVCPLCYGSKKSKSVLIPQKNPSPTQNSNSGGEPQQPDNNSGDDTQNPPQPTPPEVYAIAACIIVATAVILISNDIYAYKSISLMNRDGKNYIGGYSFGFRKNFTNSALEYGILYNEYEYKSRYDEYNGGDIGLQLNYVHDVYYNRTQKNHKIYLGPSINLMDGRVGYGGAIGTKYGFFNNRLFFDCRYELTTTTHQLQAGLVFTYQKEYFWKNIH